MFIRLIEEDKARDISRTMISRVLGTNLMNLDFILEDLGIHSKVLHMSVSD